MGVTRAVKRIGKVRTQKCGRRARCTNYAAFDDIEITFDDGTVVPHQTWARFDKGLIRHPDVKYGNAIISHSKQRVGQKKKMNHGSVATCIAYRGADDIDIQFEDGSIRRNITWDAFSKGKFLSDTDKIKVGVQVTKHSGEVMTCINYRSAIDIDVQFEDGTIAEHKTWNNFMHGEIKKPGEKVRRDGIRNKGPRVGVEVQAVNGQKMKCVAYRSARDIDVEFEDGTLVSGKGWNSFAMGNIANPNFDISMQNAVRRIGTERIAQNGQRTKCIRYNTCMDIDVEFEDGYVAKNVTWRHFERGSIKNPNHIAPPGQKRNIGINDESNDGRKHNAFAAEKYSGLKREMRDGRIATIKEYRKDSDITIRFDNGEEIRTTFTKFMNGKASETSRLGQKNTARCGMKMEIIKYGGCDNLTIRFEDGTVREHIKYRNFLLGNVAPNDDKRHARTKAKEKRDNKEQL